MYCNTVHANAQHLGILLLEPVVLHPEPGDLVCSASGEGKYVEGKHNVLLTVVMTQSDLAPQV